MNQPQRVKIFIADLHQSPPCFCSLREGVCRHGFSSLAHQPSLPHCPDLCPSAAEIAGSPVWAMKDLDSEDLISPGTCSPLTASRINHGFPGTLLTFVSCVFNIGIRVFSASQNILVQNTFYYVRLKHWLAERHGLRGVYYGSGRWGSEKTDVGLTSEGMLA